MADRVAAIVAFITAIALFALGIMLGSIANGNGAPVALLQVAGTASEVGALTVLVYAFAKIGRTPWTQAGSGLAVLAAALLMIGDSVSSAPTRDLGNAVMYLTFIVLGILMWRVHVKLAAFAVICGVAGFAFAAFLLPAGVPPLNLMLIVAWFVAVGIDWLRAPWPMMARSEGFQPIHG